MELTPEDLKKFDAYPAVDHFPAHCPNCGSSSSRIVSTRHPISSAVLRLHYCNRCPVHFKSVEPLNRVDAQKYLKADA